MHYECKSLQVHFFHIHAILNIFGYGLPYKNNDDAIEEMRWGEMPTYMQITDGKA